ncbi:hypothetical protein [Methylocapsa palsarum]|uniref:Uncharacterized protein n=1 Tax=Methylocapsa palsarum TaxID=1612308 RepID=A0A1I4C6V0_9HYPH|nr:hypothetical protein [Methylocapsa palsarum]SFK76874.1 hypothetical protein SAMN05444581_1194 [Methylocapsa palsarum]
MKRTVMALALVGLIAILLAVRGGIGPAKSAATTGGGCGQIAANLSNFAATVAADANTYFTHRTNFIGKAYPSGVASNLVTAKTEKSQADPIKANMPKNLENFRATLAAARSQGCLSSSALRDIEETTVHFARRVNFDQFPPLEETEEVASDESPPRMPR